jgi:hypothetical protein
MPSARSTSDTGTDAYWNSDATERRIQTSYGGFVPNNVIGSEFSKRMRSGMNQFRKLALACCFVLGACSGQFNASSRLRPHRAKAFTGPRKTQNVLIIGGFCSASGGTVAQGAPGAFVACVSGVQPGGGRKEHALFFKSKDPVVQRLALNRDGCTDDVYVPFRPCKIASRNRPD